ncbi:Aldedh-domain-containing protein [Violaceomyces palustris]|uniref:Aldedh-domain-containing protein n=1 Tax=Violaceomyces palustris TaxID=1673888 RepID=A0ACD0NW26_9BASI|nr:Aldedh-domain-containing protein [Violaceomyces palustris]
MLEPAGSPPAYSSQLVNKFVDLVKQNDQLIDRYFPTLQQRVPVSPTSLLVGSILTFFISHLFNRFITALVESPLPIKLSVPEQALKGWKGKILENPGITSESSPGTIVCYDPATAYHIADIKADDEVSIKLKISKAKQAQLRWSKTSFGQRRKVLNTFQKWVVDDMEMIARVAARDTGKTAIDAAFGELLTTCSKLAWVTSNGEKVLRPETRPNNLLNAHKICEVWHEPLGVVVACVSWNYSAHNTMGPIISSIFAGNAIIVKASELVAWSAKYFIEGVRECLRVCGHDPELVQLVTCFPEAAESLTKSDQIAHITFIGSEEVGRKVAMAATKELTPVTLELGGKDPAIILESADLKFFNSTFMRSCFQGAGQNCIGIERFIVSSKIVDKFLSLIVPRVKSIRCGSFMDDVDFGHAPSLVKSQDAKKGGAKAVQGDQVDCGAMITDARFGRLEQLIQDAVKQGAELVVGGKRLKHEKWANGHYFQPTLITGVTSEMKIAQEELFAPIFLVMSFETVEQAVEIANSTRYGLGSSVFGNNKEECQKVAERLKCGMVNINDFGVSYLNQGLPFGGFKKSGYGRFAGPEGLLSMTNPKSVTRNRFDPLIRTGIPPPLDYPLHQPSKSWNFVKGLILFAYGLNLKSRLKGILDLILAGI